ncbi:MAG: sugar transferase [Phycisphaerae bacterium]|jgi:sugar transferase EpsL|nr:sugar transferase [Phycisphaerae bacterium]
MIKRTFDILVSILILIFLLVPMLLVALMIRLGSPGNPIFAQRRAGKGGKGFTILKFRTMRIDADPYGSSPHSGEDPRLTRLGRFLRETSLDELPQVFNVIVGQMSLVGPRPLYERHAAQWNPHQRRRLEVLPGVTGYAQAYGRGQLTIEEKIEMDVHYVDNRSFWFDLRIILRTAGNIFRRRGEVYEKQYSSDREYENDR